MLTVTGSSIDVQHDQNNASRLTSTIANHPEMHLGCHAAVKSTEEGGDIDALAEGVAHGGAWIDRAVCLWTSRTRQKRSDEKAADARPEHEARR